MFFVEVTFNGFLIFFISKKANYNNTIFHTFCKTYIQSMQSPYTLQQISKESLRPLSTIGNYGIYQ